METIFNNAIVLATALTPFLTIAIELLKPFKIPKNFLPHTSIALGVIIGIVIALLSGNGIALYGLAGALSGASASGIYDTAKKTKSIKNKKG